MHIKAEEISQIIRDQIKDFDKKVAMEEVGTVISAGDGIAKVYGLDNVMAGELVSWRYLWYDIELGRRQCRCCCYGRLP